MAKQGPLRYGLSLMDARGHSGRRSLLEEMGRDTWAFRTRAGWTGSSPGCPTRAGGPCGSTRKTRATASQARCALDAPTIGPPGGCLGQ